MFILLILFGFIIVLKYFLHLILRQFEIIPNCLYTIKIKTISCQGFVKKKRSDGMALN